MERPKVVTDGCCVSAEPPIEMRLTQKNLQLSETQAAMQNLHARIDYYIHRLASSEYRCTIMAQEANDAMFKLREISDILGCDGSDPGHRVAELIRHTKDAATTILAGLTILLDPKHWASESLATIDVRTGLAKLKDEFFLKLPANIVCKEEREWVNEYAGMPIPAPYVPKVGELARHKDRGNFFKVEQVYVSDVAMGQRYRIGMIRFNPDTGETEGQRFDMWIEDAHERYEFKDDHPPQSHGDTDR